MVVGTGLRDFTVAVGLVLVLEGLIYALAPRLMQRMLEEMRGANEDFLRLGGLAALIAGVVLVWWVRH